jgi:hypothetical protein
MDCSTKDDLTLRGKELWWSMSMSEVDTCKYTVDDIKDLLECGIGSGKL